MRLVLAILLVLFLVGCTTEVVLDEHDCKPDHSWDKSIGACVSDEANFTSVEKETAREAAKELTGKEGVTVVSVSNETVELETTSAEYVVEDGELTKVVSDDWCSEKNGEEKTSCLSSEINIGEVKDSSKVCCVVPQ